MKNKFREHIKEAYGAYIFDYFPEFDREYPPKIKPIIDDGTFSEWGWPDVLITIRGSTGIEYTEGLRKHPMHTGLWKMGIFSGCPPYFKEWDISGTLIAMKDNIKFVRQEENFVLETPIVMSVRHSMRAGYFRLIQKRPIRRWLQGTISTFNGNLNFTNINMLMGSQVNIPRLNIVV